jgi:hypothetical protein
MQGALDAHGNGYAYMSGTSMACPYVSAAAALVMSQGAPAEDVRNILQQTATPKGVGVPNDDYGWGLLNVYGALKKASIDVTVSSPGKMSTVSSTRPTFRIDFRHAKVSTIRIKMDGVLVIGPLAENPSMGYLSTDPANANDARNLISQVYYTIDAKAGKSAVIFSSDAPGLPVGNHVVSASAGTDLTMAVPASAGVLSSSDSTDFQVSPAMLGMGWHLFSVPYTFDVPMLPQSVLGNVGVLARWNYAKSRTGEYGIYSLDGSRTDSEASFNPPSAANGKLVYSLGDPVTPGAPAGLGYWLYVSAPNGVPVPDAAGKNVDTSPYVVNLYKGWNMVGDPFTYPVDWSSTIVEYAGQRVAIQDAVTSGWISAAVFSWDSDHGQYVVMDTKSGFMTPWEAQWVRVNVNGSGTWPSPDLKLIISSNPHSNPAQ